MISARAKVCGIMAYPVEHSLSPMMHNFFADQMGIDLAYVPFPVKPEDVEAAVKGAYALNLAGMNVSVPYKQAVIPWLKGLDKAAEFIGAVNTLVKTEGGYEGYNTDAPGLLRAMREADISIEGRECLLIGAGGAAKAAAFVLGSQKAANVIVLNRSAQRAEALAGEMNQRFGRRFMTPLPLSEYKKLPKRPWLALQTTSVGMYPHRDQAPLEDSDFYKDIKEAVDIVYTPAKTRFMALVEAAGGRAVGGLDMLIYQGIEAFELWNPGQKVPLQAIVRVREMMREELEK